MLNLTRKDPERFGPDSPPHLVKQWQAMQPLVLPIKGCGNAVPKVETMGEWLKRTGERVRGAYPFREWN